MSLHRRLQQLLRLHRRARLSRGAATLAAAVLVLHGTPSAAQRRLGVPPELRGSRASVEKMYGFAVAHRLRFHLSPLTLDSAIARGTLVPLTGDSTYDLTRGVGFSYATREAQQFVRAFAPQYLWACGTPLTVTSAARPLTRQPHNANPHSVHPTGIAVDIRRPPPGRCLDWVRAALARLEEQGVVEATEEHHPVHLHVAVLAAPGTRVTLPNLIQGVAQAPRVPTTPAASVVASLRPLSRPHPRNWMLDPIPTTPVSLVLDSPPAATLLIGAVPMTSARTTSIADGEVTAPLAAPPAPPRHGITYRVRDGDSWWGIARRAGTTPQALARANHRSPRSALRPGMTLAIP